ncbi:50S ribosomal protein L18 [Candidatus Woesearchaeota archaeon]|jgi:large subunit ribosomal protein L18|nr:50S ribosomal protein L18 [Candidatus Woesearchaeota archaeon]MBT4114767.1 50S ribosomal protein L18 [Candidatus Woesearchaeota archaeon]MBT4248140.1 50S ribosomal protein L18 [Candidatus Woesearchaeota archaeon]
MASGPRFTVKYRRRREIRTNYHHRLALLKSGQHRLVIRKTNKYIICQIIDYHETGDTVLAAAHSKQLLKLGWKHNCSNTSAAYLTGLMLGAAAQKAKVKNAIYDSGLYPSTKGSLLYAALKGVVDAGLDIPHTADIFPAEDRISGKHTKAKDLSKDMEAVKKKIQLNKGSVEPKVK